MWAAAADAGMRLLPLLGQLDASWQEREDLGPAAVQGAAQAIATLLCRMLFVGSAGAWAWACRPGSAALTADARDSLAAQLAQLHSRGCRLLHWLAAGDNRAMLPSIDTDWDLLQELLCRQFAAAASLWGEDGSSSQQHVHARWALNCQCCACVQLVCMFAIDDCD